MPAPQPDRRAGRTPATEALVRLRRLRFHVERIFDEFGAHAAVHCVRDDVRPGFREVVLAYSERDALAYRVYDPFDDNDPWTAQPGAVQWKERGDLVTVVHHLLTLPPITPPIGGQYDSAPTWTPPGSAR
jgi:hypothetical protein